MAMQNIDRADSLSGSLLRRLGQKTGGQAAAGAQDKGEAVRPAAAEQADSVQLSPQALRQQQLDVDLAAARQALDALPEVREDRVAAARAKLAEGVYSTERVRGAVAQQVSGVLRRLGDLIG
jgi:hypothetical protein